ncbi:MAG TPA: hypothetical protein VGO47_06005, partial [Chlamydiales bacterium]|nr:hypothetical protein [Chlamydiales bacterium]
SREAWFYEQVKSLQGVAIPRCYGFFQIRLQSDQANNITPWQKPPVLFPSPPRNVYPFEPILEPNTAEASHKLEYMWNHKGSGLAWYQAPLEQSKTVTDVWSDTLGVEPDMATAAYPMDVWKTEVNVLPLALNG